MGCTEKRWRWPSRAGVFATPASADLSSIDLVDPRRGTHLATLLPLDKERNADRRRRAITDAAAVSASAPLAAPAGTAPLLRQYMAEYAATGLPPAYVPHDTSAAHDIDDQEPDE